MKEKAQAIREYIRDLIATKVEDLPDAEYLEVLEEIEADVRGMIDCKKEETEE